MARILEPGENPYADENGATIDYSALSCPRCGCNGVKVEQMPNPAGWMSRIGKARCEHCRARFQIQAIDEDE